MSNEIKPYVPASKSMAELTVRAVVLGLLLSVVMCAANIYVGLSAGMTVSAAIPASVISMGVLRGILRRGTILENNIVHTIASSGESLAAGIIFTVPALVLLGIWDDFKFWETTLISMAGGVMGVVMMIPLRKPMIIEQTELKFPEGVACAEVLKAGDRGGADMMGIFIALGIGGAFKALGAVVGIFRGTVEWGWRVGSTGFYAGTDISPMLMAVGFIVGWEISLLVFLGGAISYMGALPYFAYGVDMGASPLDALWDVWDFKIRYFGIGAMVTAGLYSICKIAGSMGAALKTALRGIRGLDDASELPRTEQGVTGKALAILLGLSMILSGVVYYMMTRDIGTTIVTTLMMFVLAFFFVAVASYIVGLVGSSNSPVSGMAICTVLVTAAFFLFVWNYSGDAGMLATLGVAGVVCCAACTSGDICQDLKIGQIVGATPRRLQIGEIIGTIVPAFIIAPTMNLLYRAYGIVEPVRENVPALKAPQGAMFEKLVGGFFKEGEGIPWNIVGMGAAIGLAAIVIDLVFLAPRKAKFRLHAMPLAVGMYLPWSVTFPILFGGFAYLLVDRWSKRRGDNEAKQQNVIHQGLLFSSGIVAGEAIMGILVAVLIVTGVPIPFQDHVALCQLSYTLSLGVVPALAVDLFSLAGLFGIVGLLIYVCLRKRR